MFSKGVDVWYPSQCLLEAAAFRINVYMTDRSLVKIDVQHV